MKKKKNCPKVLFSKIHLCRCLPYLMFYHWLAPTWSSKYGFLTGVSSSNNMTNIHFKILFVYVMSSQGYQPLCCWWLSCQIQYNAKILKNRWNPGLWVLIWKYSVAAIQWVPTWQGLDVFQKHLRSCALDESSLSIGRVNWTLPL